VENPFVAEIARQFSELTGLGRTEIAETLALPPGEDMGDYAFPCFALARAMKKKPAEIAQELAPKVRPGDRIAGAASHGPYVNFSVKRDAFIAWALSEVHRRKAEYGRSDDGKGRTVIVEFSSPNIAKHLGVHHLRSTMIGNSLVQINRALGYKTVAINFFGDWGTQFGVLIAAYKKWGGPETFEGDAVAHGSRNWRPLIRRPRLFG
jgi:arginyl-tRNA synthetase